MLYRSLSRAAAVPVLAAMILVAPAFASAQTPGPGPMPMSSSPVLGEPWHIELAGGLWNPSVSGQVSSEQFGEPGTLIDFNSDLAFAKTRFNDVRVVLRASRRNKFRLEYTPITYTSQTTLPRTVVFNNIAFPISLPIESNFQWKVWRVGYEYDALSFDRWYAGFFLEARYTQFRTSLTSKSSSLDAYEYTEAKAPLPAIGFVGRAWPLPNVSATVEVSGAQIPHIKNHPEYRGNYYDWNIYGTVDFTRNIGAQVGWRRMTTDLHIKDDFLSFKFDGLWFGGVVRYDNRRV